jgi:hypothetical protein
MAADPAAFTATSDQGAAVEGRVLVRCVGVTSRGFPSWALVGAPIESMLTAAGDAWAEFVLVEGTVTTARERRCLYYSCRLTFKLC